MAEFLSGDFADGSLFFTDEDFGFYSSEEGEDGGQRCTVILALRVLRGGQVQAQASSADRFMFGELLGSEPRQELGPGVCRYCRRRVFDEGQAAVAGSDALRLHERWDHLDLFQEVLEPVVVAATAAKGTRRRGKRGKEAKRMAKVEKQAKEAESAPEEDNQLALQQSQLSKDTYAPCLAPSEHATTCTPALLSPPLTILGTPILPFHLEPSALSSFSGLNKLEDKSSGH